MAAWTVLVTMLAVALGHLTGSGAVFFFTAVVGVAFLSVFSGPRAPSAADQETPIRPSEGLPSACDAPAPPRG